MRKLSKLLAAALAALMAVGCLTVCLASAPAGGDENMSPSFDLMLMVDDTRSMKRNDPNHIASTALQRFVDLLPSTGSRVGMATYNRDIMTALPIVTVESEEDREKLKRFAQDGLTQDGEYTDLPKALAYAVEKLKELDRDQPRDSRQAIIAVSDGENDYIDQTDEAVSEASLKTVYYADIPVYLIVISAKGENVAQAMEDLAGRTGGKTYFADSSDQIDGFLQDIQQEVGGLDEGDTIDVEVDDTPVSWKFDLENDIFEANLLLTHGSEPLNLELVGPDGGVIPMTGQNGVAKILTTDQNGSRTTVKLLQPEGGSYVLNMSSSGAPQHVLGEIILNKEIYVQVELACGNTSAVGAPVAALPGDTVRVTAALMRGQQAYTDLAFANLTAEVELDGQTYPMTSAGDSFTCDVSAPAGAGDHPLVVSVRGARNFNRSSDPLAISVSASASPAPTPTSTPAATASAAPTPSEAVRQEAEGEISIWVIVLIALAALIIIIVIVILLVRHLRGGETQKQGRHYIQIPGTLSVTYFQPGHIYVWDKFGIRPGAYFTSQRPQISLGQMLRDSPGYGEIPPTFDEITIAGVQDGSMQYLEIKGTINGPEGSQPVNKVIEVDTGMQSGGFDTFDDNMSAVIAFPDGCEAKITYSLF